MCHGKESGNVQGSLRFPIWVTDRIEKEVPLKGEKKMMESILGHIEFEGTSL